MKLFFLEKRKSIAIAGLAVLTALALAGLILHYGIGSRQDPNAAPKVVILGCNDLGMHCFQPDYSQFFILPPGNNLLVQVFEKTEDAELLTEGITVKYKINYQSDPTVNTNFWVYADKYGFQVPQGIGITGNGLEGYMKMDPSKRFWEVSAVPVTSKTGGTGPTSPYQTATITVLEQKTNRVLAEFNQLVVPTSPEMDCLVCHSSWLNILEEHDEQEETRLQSDSANGKLHRCNECHADPIMGAPGAAGIPSLSQAMHGFHADKMKANKMTGSISPVCYGCHPGLKTDCNRGVMRANQLGCEDCHGNMAEIAESIRRGRTPWLQELGCEKCHPPSYKVNDGELYRRSFLLNSPSAEMNNKILCVICHNSPHAEWPSLLELDNVLPETVQGKASFIQDCTVCHLDEEGRVHREMLRRK